MSVQKFEQFIKDKYDNPQAIHHYEITQTSGDTTVTIDVGMKRIWFYRLSYCNCNIKLYI